MKNTFKYVKIALLLILCNTSFYSYGQEFGVVKEQDKESFKKIAISKIRDLHFAFNKIASSSSSEVKASLINDFLPEFSSTCTIEVANRKNIYAYKIEYYLRNVLNKKYKKKYKIVDIDFVSFKIYDTLRPHETELNTFYIDYEFVQRFSASKDWLKTKEGMMQYDYVDETRKKGSFKIKRITDYRGTVWRMYYEDIKVKSLKIL